MTYQLITWIRSIVLCATFILCASCAMGEDRLEFASISEQFQNRQETVVYVTKTGSKYHRSDCRYLSRSKIKTTLKKAVDAGNGACKVCKP